MCPPLGNFGFCLFFSPSSLTSWYFFFSTYLPHTRSFFLLQLSKLPSSCLDSVTFPQTPFRNAANDYYIKAEWITGKSFLPQQCQSILPNWRKSGGERERDGVFLGTKNCRMSAFNPNSAPHYFHSLLFFFTLQTSPPPPHPCHTHRNSLHTTTHTLKRTWGGIMNTMFRSVFAQKWKTNNCVCFIPSHEVRMLLNMA